MTRHESYTARLMDQQDQVNKTLYCKQDGVPWPCEVEQRDVRLDEMQATFDLRWKADMRAIKRWQEANPGTGLVWPDHADLVVWLLEERDYDRDTERRLRRDMVAIAEQRNQLRDAARRVVDAHDSLADHLRQTRIWNAIENLRKVLHG